MDEDRLREIQRALQNEQNESLDGWLFYDFRGSDPLAYRILGLDSTEISTRRWYYFIPADGAPLGLVSTIEPYRLDRLPGQKLRFFTWQQHDDRLAEILRNRRRIAMQYSPRNAIPYISRVDAGTIETIRQLGVEVVSSADLVQFILDRFAQSGLTTYHPPVVAANAHSADPHYTPTADQTALIRPGDFVLIDLWAKEPDGVYADITWTGFMGKVVPERYQTIFHLVRDARDAAVAFVKERVAGGQTFFGHEVDAASRTVIAAAGYGDRFFHRTGHSIGQEVHGNGANMDGVETRDTRRVLPHTCFSVEPGIYLAGDFGVRSEVDVYVTQDEAIVTGDPVQTEVVPILK